MNEAELDEQLNLLSRFAERERVAAERKKWISVKDRLPPESVSVLVFEPGEQMRIDFIIKFPLKDPCFIWARCLVEDGVKTTHWMPLPAAPDVGMHFGPAPEAHCPDCTNILKPDQGSQWCESCGWRGWVYKDNGCGVLSSREIDREKCDKLRRQVCP